MVLLWIALCVDDWVIGAFQNASMPFWLKHREMSHYTVRWRHRLKTGIYKEEVSFVIMEFAEALILKVSASIYVRNSICSWTPKSCVISLHGIETKTISYIISLSNVNIWQNKLTSY